MVGWNQPTPVEAVPDTARRHHAALGLAGRARCVHDVHDLGRRPAGPRVAGVAPPGVGPTGLRGLQDLPRCQSQIRLERLK